MPYSTACSLIATATAILLLICVGTSCQQRVTTHYPPAETPQAALEAFFKALREDDIDAFYAYCSPIEMSPAAQQKMFEATHQIWEFQAAFDREFGEDRWTELMETQSPSGANFETSRFPRNNDFDWFEERSEQIAPDEVHVTLPADWSATIIRFQGEEKGWTVDLLRAEFQGMNVDMDRAADATSRIMGSVPEATAAIENGEKDFGVLIDILAKGFKSMYSIEVTPSKE